MVLSIFNYCNIVYYPCLDLLSKNRLQYVQNVCCRFVFSLRKYDHVSDKIGELRWLKMANIVKLQSATFLMKLLRLSSPIYLRQKLIFRELIHDRVVRHRDRLTMPQHQTALFQRSFTYMAVTTYNSLSTYFKLCSPRLFCVKYREYLLGQQSQVVLIHK